MSSSPTVVVRKGGVLTAFVSGVFGTLIVCIVCGVGLGWYALNIADRKVSDVFGIGQSVIESLPEWSESLPTAVSELLNDRRSPEYRTQLDYSVRLEPGRDHHGHSLAVVKVSNNGAKTVTFMSARIVTNDQNGVPDQDYRTFIATPIMVDEEQWRGPLLPGSSRTFVQRLWNSDQPADVSIEITDLRVWEEEAQTATAVVERSPTPTP